MTDKITYPEEIFEWRKKKYQGRARTRLPHQQQAETALRVNRLAQGLTTGLEFPADFLTPGEQASGERVPANLFDIAFQRDEVTGTLRLIGSGGSVVLDQRHCALDVARFFLDFASRESCGECTFCRIGSRRMLEAMNRICSGTGKPDDIERLGELAEKVAESSLCEVGKLASGPVRATLEQFPEIYEEHVRDGICHAGKCRPAR